MWGELRNSVRVCNIDDPLPSHMDGVQHYEPRFWGVDPVFSARVKLNIIDVLTLQPHPTIAGESPLIRLKSMMVPPLFLPWNAQRYIAY